MISFCNKKACLTQHLPIVTSCKRISTHRLKEIYINLYTQKASKLSAASHIISGCYVKILLILGPITDSSQTHHHLTGLRFRRSRRFVRE